MSYIYYFKLKLFEIFVVCSRIFDYLFYGVFIYFEVSSWLFYMLFGVSGSFLAWRSRCCGSCRRDAYPLQLRWHLLCSLSAWRADGPGRLVHCESSSPFIKPGQMKQSACSCQITVVLVLGSSQGECFESSPSLSASPVLAPRWSVASHTRTHKHTHTLAGTLTLHHRATGCCCWHLQLRSRYSRVFNCLFTSSYLLYNRDGRASILSGWFVLPGLHCVVFMAVPLRVCVCDCVCGGIVQGERGGHRRELSMGHQLILALMFELANQTRSVAKKVRCVAPASSLAPPPPPPPPALAVGHILRHLFLLLAGHFSWLATRQIESPTPLPLPLNWQLAVDPDSDCPCPGPVLAALPAFVGSPHQTLPVSWPTDWRLAVRPAKKRARGPRTNAAFPP